jgi:predicted membrane-bound mannosyltransferase
VHSSADVLKYRALADAALARAPHRPIRVISEEYWPLPWYFRGLPLVGYYATPPDECDGPLVIASLAQADAVRAKLRGSYRESLLGLRPGVLLVVFTLEP